MILHLWKRDKHELQMFQPWKLQKSYGIHTMDYKRPCLIIFDSYHSVILVLWQKLIALMTCSTSIQQSALM